MKSFRIIINFRLMITFKIIITFRKKIIFKIKLIILKIYSNKIFNILINKLFLNKVKIP